MFVAGGGEGAGGGGRKVLFLQRTTPALGALLMADIRGESAFIFPFCG